MEVSEKITELENKIGFLKEQIDSKLITKEKHELYKKLIKQYKEKIKNTKKGL